MVSVLFYFPIIIIHHHDWLTLLGVGVLGTKKQTIWPVASWAKALDQYGVEFGSVTLACFGCQNLGEFFGPWSPSCDFGSSFGDLRGLEGPNL